MKTWEEAQRELTYTRLAQARTRVTWARKWVRPSLRRRVLTLWPAGLVKTLTLAVGPLRVVWGRVE